MSRVSSFKPNANFRIAPNVIGANPQLKNASKQTVSRATDEEDNVTSTSVLYEGMKEKWPLIDDLWGGTKKMREAGRIWLPQEPKERDDKYQNRLDRSILFNAFRATIDKLISKPFSQSVTVSDISGGNLDRLNIIKDDVDGTGKNITQFSRELFESGLRYGLAHILVDFTRVPEDVLTLEDEEAIQPRPFFVKISAPSLIFWDIQNHPITRIPTLKEIRIKEVCVEKAGEFSDKKIIKIRVFKENIWQVWRVNEEDDSVELEEAGVNTLGIVPLVTFYVKRIGQLTAEPPFEDLAWLNIAHWQSSSDQKNFLRFARTGVLFGSGFNEDEIEQVAWGPNAFIKSTNPDAKLSPVEYKGTAIKSGEEDLLRLEERMQLLGLQPLIERTAQSTATAKVLDESKTTNDIQAWIRSLENTLVEAYELGAQWLGFEEVGDLKLNIFSDFSLSMHGTKDIDALIKMKKDRMITHETFLREIKRRGVVAETVEVEEELEELTRSEDNTNINNDNDVAIPENNDVDGMSTE